MGPNLFNNTEIAFRHQSNAQLYRAYLLFRMIGYPFLVKTGKALIGFARALRLPLRWALKWNVFDHFCGGETIEACASRAQSLADHGIGTILDFSVEGKASDADFERTFTEILKTVDAASGNAHIPFCVFKVSGIARHDLLHKVSQGEVLLPEESSDYDLVTKRVNAICKRAAEARTFVLIDAEESWIQDAIDGLALAMMRRYNRDEVVVYNTWQLYRHDRLQHLKDTVDIGRKDRFLVGAKLVRGAYMEKERERAADHQYPDPIQPDKASSDRDFNAALEFVTSNIDRINVCVGTHNEHSNQLMTELMQHRSLEKSDRRIYFAQLLGMSDHISFNLSHLGYNVAKYVPYGPVREVVPYLIRRAEENTSVEGQRGRELQLLVAERKRRRKG